MKTENLRGQAWIVFDDVASATTALRAMQDFPFFGKPMVRMSTRPSLSFFFTLFPSYQPIPLITSTIQRVQYAKTKSDAAAKLDGSWKKDLSTRRQEISTAIETSQAMEEDNKDLDKRRREPVHRGESPSAQPPNHILFIEGLPDATTDKMLAVLFKQFPGYTESRMVPGKPGIAFIEFENDMQAGVAMSGLQGFKITPTNAMKVSYAAK